MKNKENEKKELNQEQLEKVNGGICNGKINMPTRNGTPGQGDKKSREPQ